MTPQFILEKSLCREAHCASEDTDKRMAKCEIENLQWAEGYSERGYTAPPKGVLFANWNYFPSKAGDLLEAYGYACEWSDEWTTCGDCGKAVRTSPDSYSFQPSYVILNECEIVCLDCLDREAYLEEIEDNPSTCCMAAVHPQNHGYTLVEGGFESGLHTGMNDDPKKIFASLSEQGKTRLVFRMSGSSQFYSTFEVWEKIPEGEEEEMEGFLQEYEAKHGH